MEHPTRLQRAREAVAAYHERRGFLNDAAVVLDGTCDYSTDVQCALIAILIGETNLKAEQAAIRAYFIPSEEGSDSVDLGARN